MLLGKHSINIGTMSLGLDAARGHALMALRVDQDVPPNVLDELLSIPNVISARVARFG
jgi:D-3-phosphoglycerate dehydrogenase